jgi:hypothetical protein
MTARPALAALSLLALSLSLPQTAAAEKTMCGVRSVLVGLEGAQGDSAALPALGVTPSAPAVGLAVPANAEVLWCASPDDPRCAPADAGAGSGAELRSGAAVFVLPAAPPDVATSPVSTLRDARVGSRARAGVRRSLDRPPR